MTSNQVEVSVEGAFVLELADVDIEEVDGEGRRQDVGDREDESQDGNLRQECDAVSMPDRYILNIYERDQQYLLAPLGALYLPATRYTHLIHPSMTQCEIL